MATGLYSLGRPNGGPRAASQETCRQVVHPGGGLPQRGGQTAAATPATVCCVHSRFPSAHGLRRSNVVMCAYVPMGCAMAAEQDRESNLKKGFTLCCAGLIFSACASVALEVDKPQRIVSINICTDQLLIKLVDQKRIASLSRLASDPRSSWIGAEASNLHLNRGTAEEVITLNPDLIITSAFSFRPTVTILEQLGYRVIQLPIAKSLDEISSNLRILANAVGEPDRGSILINEFRSEIEHQTFRGTGPRPLFVSYEVDGWTTGKNSLVADITRTAGFETIGDRLGFSGGRKVSLEELLILQPELIDLGHPWSEPPALASESLRHPALRALLASTEVVDIPDPLWICGSTRTLEALTILRDARDGIQPRQRSAHTDG